MIVETFAMEWSALGWKPVRRVLQKVAGRDAVGTDVLEKMTLGELLYFALLGDGAPAQQT